jgi:predicted metalloprotease with PDZ domain
MNGKLIFGAFTIALGCVLVCPALAGEYGCKATTQECLDRMVTHYKQQGWIGINLEWVEDGTQMEITNVVPDGPADKVGFLAGDRITAMNGVEFKHENEEELAKLQEKRKPGVRFKFTLLRNGKKMELDVTLGSFPDDVIARSVGYHMLDHVTRPEKGEKTAKKDTP